MANMIAALALVFSFYFHCQPCPVDWVDCPAMCTPVSIESGRLVFIPFASAP